MKSTSVWMARVIVVATATAGVFVGIPGSVQQAHAVQGTPALSEFQPTTSTSDGKHFGGRTVAITVSPSSTSVAIAASENGGLWRTSDGGANWGHLDGLVPFNMSDVKYQPLGLNDVVLATTFKTTDSKNPGGIYRSGDGGDTWTHEDVGSCTGNQNAWGIAFEPGTTYAYVGTDCGLAVSTDLGMSWTIQSATAIGTVWSVVARPGGTVDVCGNSGHYRFGRPFINSSTLKQISGPNPIGSGGGCSGNGASVPVHSLAASPYGPEGADSGVLFAMTTGLSSTLCGGTASKQASVGMLYENDTAGTGAWTALRLLCNEFGGGRPFVVTHPSIANALQFDIFFGGGLTVHRGTCSSSDTTSFRCPGGSLYHEVVAGHSDPSDVAFRTDSNNCAEFLVDDGGVENSTSQAQPSCGDTFGEEAGSGRIGGYNALQVTDISGQVHPDHTDLFLSTWHNGLWESPDGGLTWPDHCCAEGGHFQAPGHAPTHDGQIVTMSQCVPCGNSVFLNHQLSSNTTWQDPGAASTVGFPILLGPLDYPPTGNPPLIYIQTQTEAFLHQTVFWLGRVTMPVSSVPPAVSYSHVLTDGGHVLARGETLYPPQQISGPVTTVYQAYCVTTTNCGSGAGPSAGVARILGVFTQSASFQSITAPANSTLPSVTSTPLNGILLYCDDPAEAPGADGGCQAAFAADPLNANNLIAADSDGAGSIRMMRTFNGGTTWNLDTQLTNLALGHNPGTGANRFTAVSPANLSQVRAIAYDPTNDNHIFVGTEAAGVFASFDGGANWIKIPGSERIPNVESFFFDDLHHDVLISSYGRGLWKLHLGALAISYQLGGVPALVSGVNVVNVTLGTRTPMVRDDDGFWRALETTDTAISTFDYAFEVTRGGQTFSTVNRFTHTLTSSEVNNSFASASYVAGVRLVDNAPLGRAITPGVPQSWAAGTRDDFGTSQATTTLGLGRSGVGVESIVYSVASDQLCLFSASGATSCAKHGSGVSTLSDSYVSVDVAATIASFPAGFGGEQLNMTWAFTMQQAAASAIWNVTDSFDDPIGFHAQRIGQVGVTHPPTVGALTPSSGTVTPGSATLFTTTISDPDGYSELDATLLEFLGRTSPFSDTLQYSFRRNLFIVGTSSCAPGSTTTPSIADSNLTLDCFNSKVENVACFSVCKFDPTTLRVTWRIAFGSVLSGVRYDEYLTAFDQKLASSGSVLSGNIAIDYPPTFALSPTSGSQLPNASQVFTGAYSDLDGTGNMTQFEFHFTGSILVCGSTCSSQFASAQFYYFSASNTLAIGRNGGGFLATCTPGASQTIDAPNALAMLDCSKTIPLTTKDRTGNPVIQIPWTVIPKSIMSGSKWSTLLAAVDKAGVVTGPTVLGSWTVNTPPGTGVNDPSSGASNVGQVQTFVTTCGDPDGWHNLATIDLKISKGQGQGDTEPVALWVEFDENQNLIRFYDPDTRTWSEGTAGSDVVLSSRFAELHLAGTSIKGSGPTGPSVKITWDVVFKQASANDNYQQYVRIVDDTGASTGFDKVGQWTVDA